MEKIFCLFAILFVIGVCSAASTPPSSTNTTTTSTTTTTTTTTTPTPTTPKHNTTTSTTNKPTTTTTMAPSPAPKSDNQTSAMVFNYTVYDNTTKNYCIVAQMGVKLVFSYMKINSTQKTGIEWNLPNNTMVNTTASHCGNNTQRLVLSFFDGWQLSLTFNKTAKDKYEVNSTSLYFQASDMRFPDISLSSPRNANVTSTTVAYQWSDNTAFKCKSSKELQGFSGTDVNVTLAMMETNTVILEAFRDNNKTAPSTGPFTYCSEDTSVSNIVPIAVGAALAGLVLIVLIAYLIGRSRNQRGYESV